MLARIKHIILFLCMLVSINQSVHILSHIFSEHEDSQSELVHINDHKCQLCHVDINSLIPEIEENQFEWKKESSQHITYFHLSTQQKPVEILYFSLRAPPVMI